MKINEIDNDWFDIKLLILFSWNWSLDDDEEFSESCQVLLDLRKRLIEKEKKMIFETEMTEFEDKIEHEIEH